MIKVAVIEDNAEDQAHMVELLKALEKRSGDDISARYFNSADSFFMEPRFDFDIIYLDIDLPGTNGLDAAAKIRQFNKTAILIFTTNIAQYATKGYEVNAFDFIVKPIKLNEFLLKMDRVIESIRQRRGKSVLVNDNDEIYVVPVFDILYLEVKGHYVIYHTIKRDYSEYATLKEVESKLSNPTFERCNRCYLVNLFYVSSIKQNNVVLKWGDEETALLISRPKKKAFIEALSDYAGGMR